MPKDYLECFGGSNSHFSRMAGYVSCIRITFQIPGSWEGVRMGKIEGMRRKGKGAKVLRVYCLGTAYTTWGIDAHGSVNIFHTVQENISRFFNV